MAAKVKCIVVDSKEDSGAFAIRADNEQSVYIPHKISDTLEIEEFDELECIVVANDRPNIPWRAIKVRRFGSGTEVEK